MSFGYFIELQLEHVLYKRNCNTQVKTQLAEKAVQAAKAAEEALTGKKVVVDQLQEEVREAQSVVQEESSSLEQEQANVNAALQAARQSQDQVIYLNLIRLRNISVNWNPSDFIFERK